MKIRLTWFLEQNLRCLVLISTFSGPFTNGSSVHYFSSERHMSQQCFFLLCYSTLETNVFYLSILEDGALLGRFSHFVFYLAKIQ